MTSPWGDGQVAMLKRLWAEGNSAQVIAARLGNGTTRSAVIGKVARLRGKGEIRVRAADQDVRSLRIHVPQKPSKPPTRNWSMDAPNGAQPRLAPVPQLRSKPIAAPPIAREPTLMPDGGRLTVLHLSDKTCRWPIGDVGSPDFCFCGNRPETGPPYCDYHTRVASNGFPTRSHRSATVDRRWAT